MKSSLKAILNEVAQVLEAADQQGFVVELEKHYLFRAQGDGIMVSDMRCTITTSAPSESCGAVVEGP